MAFTALWFQGRGQEKPTEYWIIFSFFYTIVFVSVWGWDGTNMEAPETSNGNRRVISALCDLDLRCTFHIHLFQKSCSLMVVCAYLNSSCNSNILGNPISMQYKGNTSVILSPWQHYSRYGKICSFSALVTYISWLSAWLLPRYQGSIYGD